MDVKIGIQDLEALIGQLEADGPSPVDGLLSEICEALGSILGVKSDEIALLEITPNRSSLKFFLPEKLRNAGPVPLMAEGARPLSVRTVLERKPEIVNDFASRPHARAFETVSSPTPIQKIISAPVFAGGLVIGVVQVSRKGVSSTAAGPDFSATDLRQLQQANSLLARIITAGAAASPKKELTQTALASKRRATRVTIQIPVDVIRQGPKNEIAMEEAQTLTVNAYGACIILKTASQLGQNVVLIHKRSGEEMLCRVLNTRPIPKSTNHEVGLEFTQPSPLFWHITFPPEDWDLSVRERASTPRKKA